MKPAPLVLTPGDPAGIGPEIALKAWASLRGEVPFALLADPAHLAPLAARAGVKLVPYAKGFSGFGTALPFLPLAWPVLPVAGQIGLANAGAVVETITLAVALVQKGEFAAIVTNPVSKAVLKQGAGFAFPGHTEFLAHLAGGAQPVMMLASADLRVVPVTVHVPLADVPGLLTAELLDSSIRITHAALRARFGIDAPRLAVAGLNPHAGETGLMGREEIEVIIPVLEALRREGFAIAGPLPADTMFHPAARARYDAAICMYHDQALLPLKTLDFANGVNVTLGLPFIRTSPDHGTAFDIAGKGLADPSSLIAAMRMAWEMAQA